MIELPRHWRLKEIDGGDYGDGGHANVFAIMNYAGVPTVEFDEADTAGVGRKMRVNSVIRNSLTNKYYACHDATAGTAVWVEMGSGGGSGGSGIAIWSSGTEYTVDAVILYADRFWKCTALHTSGASFDITKFLPLSEGVRKITAVGHGLAVKNIVRPSGVGYVKAQADIEGNISNPPSIVWMVSGDSYVVVTGGMVTLSAHGYGLDTIYYTSGSTAGAVVTDAPSVANAVFRVIDANNIMMYWGSGSGGTQMKVNQPINSTPSSGTTGTILLPQLTASAFTTLPLNGDTHIMSDWEVATDSAFTSIVSSSYNNTVHKVSWLVTTSLAQNTQHWWRIRYKGEGLGWSKWSDGTTFTTRYVVTPIGTTPANGATGVIRTPVLNSNTFATSPEAVDTHLHSDWEVATDTGFTNIVASVYNSTTDKTSWMVSTQLNAGTTYYYRVRYCGTSLGDSQWSEGVEFTTGLVDQATNNTPLNGAIDVSLTGPITSGSFSTTPVACDAHFSSDWEMYSDAGMTTLVRSSYDNMSSKVSWTVSPKLLATTQYWYRVRHKGVAMGFGAWSNATSFTTLSVTVNPSTITSPTEGVTGVSLTPTITSSAFDTTPTGEDTHLHSDWEVATDSGFTTIIASSYDDTVNKTSWVSTSLPANTPCYTRVRHHGTIYGDGPWSTVVSFTTRYVVTPIGTSPVNGSTGCSLTPLLSSSTFTTSPGGVDTHLHSDWEVATDALFANIVESSYNDTVNKTSYAVSTPLGAGTTYYSRLRHTGTLLGDSSWSTGVMFTTGRVNKAINSDPTNNETDVSIGGPLVSAIFATTPMMCDGQLSADWEVYSDAGMTTLVRSSYNNTSSKTSWVITPGLNIVTQYWWRVRHKGTAMGFGEWSDLTRFTTLNISVAAPSVTYPSEGMIGIELTPGVTSSAFDTAPTGQDTHLHSDWEVATDSGFTSIIASSYDDTVNKTGWMSTTSLPTNTICYVRVRHHGTIYGDGPWSTVVSFKTKQVATPTIEGPTNNSTGNSLTLTIASSTFNTIPVESDWHLYSDWEVATDALFTDLVESRYDDDYNLTEFQLPAYALDVATTYYTRVRHTGNSLGKSAWSTAVVFTTGAILTPTNISPINDPLIKNTMLTGPLVGSNFETSPAGCDSLESVDCEIYRDEELTDVVISTSSATNPWDIDPPLEPNTVYWWRMAYKGVELGYSEWSTATVFHTAFVEAPTIASPFNGSLGNKVDGVITSAPFDTTAGGTADTHQMSDWELYSDAGMTTLVESNLGNTTSLTSWDATTILSPNTSYWVRSRHKGVAFGWSDWGDLSTFTTGYILAPTVLFPADSGIALIDVYPESNGLTTSGIMTDTLVESDWELYSDVGMTTLVQSGNNASGDYRTMWFRVGSLIPRTQYWVRCRHRGGLTGWSEWGSLSTFTTAHRSTPSITTPATGTIGVEHSPRLFGSASTITTGSSTPTVTRIDWEIYSDSGLTALVYSATVNSSVTNHLVTTVLASLTTYWARVRYSEPVYGDSDWSEASSFTTSVMKILAPTITSPGTYNPVNTMGFSTSAFATTPAGSDTHLSTDREIATDAEFTNIIYSNYNNTTNLTFYTFPALSLTTPGGTYYVRVRYNGNTLGAGDWASKSTIAYKINTPTMTAPSEGETGVSTARSLSSSVFSAVVSTTHVSSSWEVSTDSGFSTIVKSLYTSTTSKTGWYVELDANTTYYARVKHHASTSYLPSDWSPTRSFTTGVGVTKQPTLTSASTWNIATQGSTMTFSSSAFITIPAGIGAHEMSDWELSTNSGFTAIIASSLASTTNKTTWSATVQVGTLYLRVKHKGTITGWSSALVAIITVTNVPVGPASGTTYLLTSSSGSWTAPTTASYNVKVELWGAGGGGGFNASHGTSGSTGGSTTMLSATAYGGSGGVGTSGSGSSASGGTYTGTYNVGYPGGNGRKGGGGAGTREGMGATQSTCNGASGASGSGAGTISSGSAGLAGGGGGGAGRNGGSVDSAYPGGTGTGADMTFSGNGGDASGGYVTAGVGGPGGGGGGGGEYNDGCGGGGGGYCARSTVAITGGSSYAYTVGQGGSPGTCSTDTGRTAGRGGNGAILITVL